MACGWVNECLLCCATISLWIVHDHNKCIICLLQLSPLFWLYLPLVLLSSISIPIYFLHEPVLSIALLILALQMFLVFLASPFSQHLFSQNHLWLWLQHHLKLNDSQTLLFSLDLCFSWFISDVQVIRIYWCRMSISSSMLGSKSLVELIPVFPSLICSSSCFLSCHLLSQPSQKSNFTLM